MNTTDSVKQPFFSQVADHLSNGNDWAMYFACLIMCYVGYALYYAWTVKKGVENSSHSVNYFDFSYWWTHNAFDMVRDMFTLALVVLFYPDLVNFIVNYGADIIEKIFNQEISGKVITIFKGYTKATLFVSIVVGVCWRMGVNWYRKRKWKKKNK